MMKKIKNKIMLLLVGFMIALEQVYRMSPPEKEKIVMVVEAEAETKDSEKTKMEKRES